jgi:flagellar motor switch protein FliN/FliY
MKNTRAQAQLAHHIETGLGQALLGMTGAAFTIAARDKTAEPAEADESFLWQQSFATVEGPAFWISAGKTTWESIGRLTLVAAGEETPSPEDCRSTWQEIVSQALGALAAGITADMEREISAAKGEELQAEPPGVAWMSYSIIDAENKAWPFKIAWSQELANLYEIRAEATHSPAARENTVSKTFDLLLEVALPVSVSFGRTSLQIREVLKLNTGSIVELDRFVTDPVEVVVNDCVIGHGEVVVVDGNYGVRINQLASREDRLRTGVAEHIKMGGRP